MKVAQKYQEHLKNINENIQDSYKYFKGNYDRFQEFFAFFFKSTLTDEELQVINSLQRPKAQFNIGEAHISRLLGEFFKIEFDAKVSQFNDKPVGPELITFLEDHFRHILFEFGRNGSATMVMKDQMGGGFSAAGVGTDYEHDRSFNQVINVFKEYSPILTFWDMKAILPSKSDGDYCGRIYPMRKEEVERTWDVDLKNVSFIRNEEGFNWNFTNAINNQKICMVCEYFEKKKKKEKIVQLVTGQTITQKQYDDLVERWNASGTLAVPPAVKYSRWTDIQYICRYITLQNQVLSYEETLFKDLPIIFFGGNSVIVQTAMTGSYEEITKPLLYNCKDSQKLVNVAGQSLAQGIEMITQTKLFFPKEGLPDEQPYRDMITNPQLPGVFFYKAYNNNDPNQPLPQPREVNKIPLPPEVFTTFDNANKTFQNILGMYDGAMGINNNQLSGKAIIASTMQSNSAAMNFLIGYCNGFSQILKVALGIIPEVYMNRGSVPVMRPNGKVENVTVYHSLHNPDGNSQGAIDINYQPELLDVKVDISAGFGLQQEQARQQIISLQQVSPMFAEFMNTQGLDILLDNYEFRGIEQLKQRAKQYMQQKQQEAANKPPDPMTMKIQLEQQKLQLQQQKNQIEMQMEQQKNQMDAQLQAAKIAVENESVENQRMEIIAKIQQNKIASAVSMDKASAERARAAVDLAIKEMEMTHRHSMDKFDAAMKHSNPETTS